MAIESKYLVKLITNYTKGSARTYAAPFHDHEWVVGAGFGAPIQMWEFPKGDALAIMNDLNGLQGKDREVQLVLGDPADPLFVSRVLVVGTAPSRSPQRLCLLLSDVRWYFARFIMVYDANVRRRLGEKFLLGSTLTDVVLADRVAYASWSINGSGTGAQAYTWTPLSNQVTSLACAGDSSQLRPSITFVVDPFSLDIQDQVCMETIQDGEGTMGLARAIEAVPGAGMYVDVSGVVHIFDASPGAEIDWVQTLPPPLWNHGSLALVDCSPLRPKNWHVYFDYAVEVRFDFNPVNGTAPPAGQNLANALAQTYLVNVLQVTDLTLPIPAGPWGSARTVSQGTWISVDEAYAAWGPKTLGSLSLPTLSDDVVRIHWFADGLYYYTLGPDFKTPDPIWSMRISELMRCYRSYFRVNSSFWDRVRHFWASRVAIWDPTTGTRAPSPVYSNFSTKPLDVYASAVAKEFTNNVTGSFDASSNQVGTPTSTPSGFHVVVEDEELMIVSIDRDITKFPGVAWIAPSPVEETAAHDLGPDLNQASLQKLVALASWNLSTIMTCSPASPNDKRRLYSVVVNIARADVVAGLTRARATPQNGPDQEFRTHLAEARVAWQDDDETSSAIVGLFGGATGTIGGQNNSYQVSVLDPINLQSELTPLAEAIAAADLISKLDHYEGERAVPMRADAVPLGSISRVHHCVRRNRAFSLVHAEGVPRAVNAIDLLQGTARGFILKQIQQGRVQQ